MEQSSENKERKLAQVLIQMLEIQVKLVELGSQDNIDWEGISKVFIEQVLRSHNILTPTEKEYQKELEKVSVDIRELRGKLNSLRNEGSCIPERCISGTYTDDLYGRLTSTNYDKDAPVDIANYAMPGRMNQLNVIVMSDGE